MMVEILLVLIFVALVVIGYRVDRTGEELRAWQRMWANSPQWASDYHAKESLKVLQEIAHYLALELRDRRARSDEAHTENPRNTGANSAD